MNIEDSSIIRPYPKKAVIDELLGYIHDLKDRYENVDKAPLNKLGKLEGTFITFLVLKLIEEDIGGPAFSAIPKSSAQYRDGTLKSLLGFPEQIVQQIAAEQRIPRIQADFRKRMGTLITNYNQGAIAESDELVLEILKTFDYGFEGHGYRLIETSIQEYRERQIKKGETPNPIEEFDITGNLASRYSELYMSKVIRPKTEPILDEEIK